jgi:hypothetical protein
MRLIWSLSGSLYALNVLGVVNAGSVAITQALTNTLGTAIKAGLTSSGLGAQLGTAVALANIGLRDIRTANTAEFLDTAGATAGTGAGDVLPPQTAMVVTLRTAQAGRRFRGRVYLPGFVEATNSALGAYVGAAGGVAFVTAIQSALITSGLNLGVLSRPNPDALPPSAGFITVVTAIVIRDLIWDTQRRRAVPGI